MISTPAPGALACERALALAVGRAAHWMTVSVCARLRAASLPLPSLAPSARSTFVRQSLQVRRPPLATDRTQVKDAQIPAFSAGRENKKCVKTCNYCSNLELILPNLGVMHGDVNALLAFLVPRRCVKDYLFTLNKLGFSSRANYAFHAFCSKT